MGIRIGRFEHEGRIHWSIVGAESVAPLPGAWPTLRALLEQGDLRAQLAAAAAAGGGLPLDAVRWHSPVTREAQIVCQGVNYASHRIEGGYAAEHKPPFNMIFTKASSALCGPNDDVIRPPHVRLLDYEVELGVVVGRAITGPAPIVPGNLHEYVAGIVVADDVSARDVQIPQEQWIKGKSYRTFCPVGPYLYLLDPEEMGYLDDLEMNLWVNGELRQSASTGQMLYKPHETLAELSGVMDLFPGDLLMTGTPAGVALKAPRTFRRKLAGLFLSDERRMEAFVASQIANPRYLQGGDVVRVTIRSADGRIDLGVQENRVRVAAGG